MGCSMTRERPVVRKSSRRLLAVMLAGILAASAAACGDDDADDRGASPRASSAPDSLEGEPVQIGTILNLLSPTSVEYVRAGIDAGIRAVNEAGGINGRPLEIEVCVHEVDPNDAARCARGLAGNESIVALAATFSSESEAFDPILEEARLASIGQSLYNRADFSSPVVFPADGGTVSGIAAAGPICLNDLAGDSISLLYADVGTAAQVVTIMNEFVLKPFDTELSAAVPFPITASDLSAPAAEIAGDAADCVAIVAAAESSVQLVESLRQQGYKGHILLPALVVSEQTLREELDPEQIEDVILVRAYDYGAPLFEEFLADLNADAGSNAESLISDHTVKAWLAIKIFAEIAKEVSVIDRPSVLAAAKTFRFDSDGLLPEPLDYGSRIADADVLGGSAPNLIAAFAMGVRATDGEPVTGAFQDVFGGPDQ